MHLTDALIQSDLQYIQVIHIFFQFVCSLGIEPTTFCAANAMLYHWATGTYFNEITEALFSDLVSITKSNKNAIKNWKISLIFVFTMYVYLY